MASIISAGTTSGTSLNLSGDTSGVLQLATNGSTTAVTITTAQNVGIGTTSVSGAKMDVNGGLLVSGALTLNQTDKLYLEYSSNIATLGSYGNTAGSGIVRIATGGGGGSGGQERMRITSTGVVSVGSSTVAGWTSPFNAIQLGTTATVMATSGSTQLGQNIYYDGSYKFIGTGYANRYYQNNGDHTWTASSASGSAGGAVTENIVLTLSSSGCLVLKGGTGTASVGIAFPATQSASSNANTLDDYEEGTFTPTIGGTVSDGTASYTTQQGQYTKIGNRVFFSLRVGWSSGTGSGSMVIRGLPFTQVNGFGDIPYSASEWSDIAWSANYSPTPVGQQNGTHIYLNQSRIGGSGPADNTAYDAAGFMSIAGHYQVA